MDFVGEEEAEALQSYLGVEAVMLRLRFDRVAVRTMARRTVPSQLIRRSGGGRESVSGGAVSGPIAVAEVAGASW